MPGFVGTSGWQYADWRGCFYPSNLPTREWLHYYGTRFVTVEVNNAFYRLPERSVFEKWAEQTPADFVVAVKASRYLTHVRRLHDPGEPVNRLVERARGLGGKLGPLLLQLPPNMKKELEALDETLAAFPAGIRVAVEPRHDSWFSDDTADLLSRRGAALCLVDRLGTAGPLWRTADWAYVRFHEGGASPHPRYGQAALRTWAERIAEMYPRSATVYAYFNNDAHGAATKDAELFTRELMRAGLDVARPPS